VDQSKSSFPRRREPSVVEETLDPRLRGGDDFQRRGRERGDPAHYPSPFPAGTSTSRLPFAPIAETSPERSICSIRRAERL